MTQGLRVWNASGNLMLDVTDRISRYVGNFPFTIPANQRTVFIPIAGVEASSWFAYSPTFIGGNCIPTTGGFNFEVLGASTTPRSGTIDVFRI